jgi:hypothetical protein
VDEPKIVMFVAATGSAVLGGGGGGGGDSPLLPSALSVLLLLVVHLGYWHGGERLLDGVENRGQEASNSTGLVLLAGIT